MAEKQLKFYRYRYEIKNMVLTMDKDYPLRDEMALSFSMLWDFSRRKLPVLQLNIQLEKDLIVTLFKYKETAKIKLDIYETQYEGEGWDNRLGTSLWLTHSFNIIPLRELGYYTSAVDTELLNEIDPMAQPQGVELYLIDLDIVNKFTQELSINANDISKPALLQGLFSMRNIPAKEVIATPPEDSSVVDKVVLSLGSLVSNIDELNMRYGIYSAGVILFHDLTNLYCINRVTPNIEIPSTNDFDSVTFLLPNPNAPEITMSGGYTDFEMKKHYIMLNGKPEIYDYKAMINPVEFSTMETIDAQGTVDKITLDPESTKMNYRYKHNTLSVDQEINEKIITDQIVTFTIADSPISFFKPHKTYNFITDTMYNVLDLNNHIYRLNYLEFGIAREGAYFESTMQIKMVRVSKTSGNKEVTFAEYYKNSQG